MFAKVNGDTSFYQKAIFVLSRFGESNEGVSGVFFKQRVACLAEHQLLSLIIFGQKCPRLAVLEPKLLIRHFVPSLLAHVYLVLNTLHIVHSSITLIFYL